MRKTSESEDNSIGAMLYQGKPLSQWEKEFEGEFTAKQLLQLIRSGVDIGRIQLGLVDEADDFNDPVFKDEKFADQVFESRGDSIKNYIMPNVEFRVFDSRGNEIWCMRVKPNEAKVVVPYVGEFVVGTNPVLLSKNIAARYNGQKVTCMLYVDGKPMAIDRNVLKHQIADLDQRIALVSANTLDFSKEKVYVNEVTDEEAALDESLINPDPEDVVTVEDFISMLKTHTQPDDKLLFRVNKQEHSLFDAHSKGGVAVIDFVKGKYMNEDVELEANETADDFMTVSDLQRLGKEAYPNNDSAWLIDNIAGIVNGKVIDFSKIKYVRPEGYPSNGTFFLLDGTTASNDAFEKEKAIMLSEAITPEQWQEAVAWFNGNGYEIEDDEVRLEQFGPQMDQFLFKVGMSPTGKDEIVSGDRAYELYKSLKESKMKKTNEGRGWYGGGYGGTGRSWKSLGGKGPRGADIGWYAVADLDPKAKGKVSDKWRCGPSNFPFKDTFFPNRNYKIGTMVMRNKYVNAGPFSGEMYIAIPSYFEIVNSGNAEGIDVLNTLGIPLDLTFGMDPKDDYTMTYTEK